MDTASLCKLLGTTADVYYRYTEFLCTELPIVVQSCSVSYTSGRLQEENERNGKKEVKIYCWVQGVGIAASKGEGIVIGCFVFVPRL